MRIAHVITRMILGGAQENTLLCCQDLMRDYGDDVLLVTGPALGPEGSLIERGRAGEVPTEIIPSLRRAINPWRDAASYFAVRRALDAFRPDVVHTHSAKGGILGRAAAWALGVPAIVHTVHGAPFHPYQSAIARAAFRRCETWAAARCHRLISVADAMTELMVTSGVAPRDKFTRIYSGMEIEPFLRSGEHRSRVREELGFEPDTPVVGTIARLAPLKGYEHFAQAARYAVRRDPRLRFLVVGDGPKRRSYLRLLDRLSIPYRWAGLVPPDRLPGMLAAMDIVVHASLREGLARVLPQALLSGKPVVSFDIDGAREVVRTGETGVLVPPCDAEGLGEGIVLLAQQPELGRRLAEQGRQQCIGRFDHREMTARVRRVYGEVMGHAM